MDKDDDSFIILSSSPPQSVDFDLKSLPATIEPMLNSSLHELMSKVDQENSISARISVIENGPSQTSLMVASTIIADKTPKQLQTSMGEVIEENTLLKGTLKKNNDLLREQFLLVASCQEDIVKTHQLYKDKFNDTKDLIERLRQENKTLKQEMMKLLENTHQNDDETHLNYTATPPNELVDSPAKSADDGAKPGFRSNASSMMEFVTCPDDDVIDKLTAQLELVESQRRQVIMDNDKLTWQKESLERVVDATTKERDQLKKDIKNMEEINVKEKNEHITEVTKLSDKISDLEKLLKERESMVSLDEVRQKDVVIQQSEVKVATLQSELKTAQLKLQELENIKLDLAKEKSAALELTKLHKQQIEDLQNRLKEAQTVVTEIEPLTSALLARAEELKVAKSEIADLRKLTIALREEKDEKDLLRAQIDVYKSDFLCEREAREKLACEKETVAAELRGALKKKQELFEQLEEVRKLNPNIHKSAITKKSKPQTLTSIHVTAPEGSTRTPSAPSTTGNMVYTCPKCLRYSSDQYKEMEDHFDFCLDDF